MNTVRKVFFWLGLVCIFILAGCVQVISGSSSMISTTPYHTLTIPSTATETPTPLPTGTQTFTPLAPTASPRPSNTPTVTLPPTETLTSTVSETPTFGPSPTRTRTITNTPTITFTPTPPFSLLRISKPGLQSRLLSPINIEAMVTKGEDGYVYINLVGEDGRTINSLALDHRRNPYSRFLIAPQLDFSIPGLAEAARLEMYTLDIHGRLIALSSVDVVLLSLGTRQVFPPDDLLEPYIIRYPYENQLISGGNVLVSGLASPVNETPLILELIKEDGSILASTTLEVQQPQAELSHTPFAVNIEYQVAEEIPVRLTIRQESATRIPGTVALASLPLILLP